MHKLIIVGNGFDLAHGIKSKFSDFLIHLIRSVLSKWNDDLKRTDEVMINGYLELRINNPGMQLDLREYHSIESIKESQRIRIHKAEGIYGILNLPFSDNWSDVEYQYYLMLGKKKIGKEVKELNDSLEQFRKEFREYLCAHLTDHGKEVIVENNKKVFTSKTSHSLKYKKHIVLNFNYTQTVLRYFTLTENHNVLINIHGSLEEDNIILGYGDEHAPNYAEWEQTTNNEYLRFSKSPKYALNDQYRSLISHLDEPYDVHIVGHSCGITDRTLLKELLETEKCQNIYVRHHNGLQSFSNVVYGLMRQFDDKVKLRNKLHEFDKTLTISQAPPIGKIVSAFYGKNPIYTDVLDKVKDKKRIVAAHHFLDIPDPYPREIKHLILTFEYPSGKRESFKVDENQSFYH